MAVDEWPIIQSTQGNGGVPCVVEKSLTHELAAVEALFSSLWLLSMCCTPHPASGVERTPLQPNFGTQPCVEGLISKVRLLLFLSQPQVYDSFSQFPKEGREEHYRAVIAERRLYPSRRLVVGRNLLLTVPRVEEISCLPGQSFPRALLHSFGHIIFNRMERNLGASGTGLAAVA